MRPEDFRPDDLFAQIQGLVDGLADERRAREAAEAADKAKSDLLAMVGHELRTPMEAVIAMAELMLASPLDPTQQRYARDASSVGAEPARRAQRRPRLLAARGRPLRARASLLRPARSDPGRGGGVANAGEREGSHRRRRYRGQLPALHRRRCRAPAPSADQPRRQRAQIHRHRLGASACERERGRRTLAPQIRRHRYRRGLEQGRAGAIVPALRSARQSGCRARMAEPGSAYRLRASSRF